jgi:putative PIN family toxin of toxin-antitoxin system
MRIVLDTNVLVRATGTSHGPGREVFVRLLTPPHVIVVSNFLLDELRRVLNYPRVLRMHGLTAEEIEHYVRDVESVAELVDVRGSLFQVRHDPDDDPVVATAVYGRVDALCTLDRHLRRPEVASYCGQFNVRVLTDVELLSELQAS